MRQIAKNKSRAGGMMLRAHEPTNKQTKSGHIRPVHDPCYDLHMILTISSSCYLFSYFLYFFSVAATLYRLFGIISFFI